MGAPAHRLLNSPSGTLASRARRAVFARTVVARCPRPEVGVEEPRFVCQQDRLDAIAEVELLQYVGDVVLTVVSLI